MLAQVRTGSVSRNAGAWSAAKTLHFACALHSVARSTVVSLMPRAGVFTIRSSETSSSVFKRHAA